MARRSREDHRRTRTAVGGLRRLDRSRCRYGFGVLFRCTRRSAVALQPYVPIAAAAAGVRLAFVCDNQSLTLRICSTSHCAVSLAVSSDNATTWQPLRVL